MLVTQNIDNLHTREIKNSKVLMSTPDKNFVKTADNKAAFTPHIYEIHGNVLYMHCSSEDKDHSNKLIPGPTLEVAEEYAKQNNGKVLVPKCKECGCDMKPHCMFFDENYNEKFYRYETVQKYVNEADCLIVVGTALATNFALKIVKTLLIAEKPVIEINLESSIKRGHNI